MEIPEMHLSIHSGLGGQRTHGTLTTHTHFQGDCRITHYEFTDHRGSEFEVVHFEHDYLTSQVESFQVEYSIDADVVLL